MGKLKDYFNKLIGRNLPPVTWEFDVPEEVDLSIEKDPDTVQRYFQCQDCYEEFIEDVYPHKERIVCSECGGIANSRVQYSPFLPPSKTKPGQIQKVYRCQDCGWKDIWSSDPDQYHRVCSKCKGLQTTDM